ncbi:hypothetical protein H4J02_03455 [Protaetiibacter sp. SSC-01]|uniref:hypothetical protein n=1 Tax=Protaetiibacter sp. SSC-01 TaxID=2759943 RepID=UPI00165727D4|nr:hypothetical protein [Protaetiibacter sp. SSC-01]QNO38099.1 hypothetical protein H4J02_03455 [Protaetiibacter sp. SSC-01]
MKLKKTITALAAAFALTIGGAASAAIAYTPAEFASGPATVAPGQPATFAFDSFQPNEPVTFTLRGENASGATLAALAVVDEKSLAKAADGSGVATVTVTLPSNAVGSYTLTATGAQSGSAQTTITVSIAATGADVSPVLLWGAVGAVGLGAIALIAVAAVRRSRQSELVEQR